MAEQSTAKSERRAAQRYALTLPVTLIDHEGTKQANTRNVSSRSVAFVMDKPMAEGTEVTFTLTLPSEVTLTADVNVQCHGRVLRTEVISGAGPYTVIAIIERYEFLGGS